MVGRFSVRAAVPHRQTLPKPIRILIVLEQKFVADALESLLARQPGMMVVGKSSIVESPARVAELTPDVVILAFRADDEAAAAAVRAIFRTTTETKLIFVAADDSDSVVLAAIEAGASGVLSASMRADELIHSVRVVADGESLISPQTIANLLSGRRKSDGLREKLTCREREIVSLIAEGASNRAIATLLGISYVTVRTHVRNIASKLAAHSKLEVLVRAQQLDLVSKRSTPMVTFGTGVANVASVSN
jgi:DNA-binding NarL/FixJ family response regulator